MIFTHQISKKNHLLVVEMPRKECPHTLLLQVCPTKRLKQLALA